MNKLLSTLAVLAFGVAALAVAAPALARLIHAAVPLVLVTGVVAVVARLAWWYTKRW